MGTCDIGAEERLAAAEARLDEALEAVLDAEISGDEGDDDFEDEEEEGKGREDEGEGEKEVEEMEGGERGEEAERKGPPPNFSRVVTTAKPVDDAAFPYFKEAIGGNCEVGEGEMLYLPAGWFHEVTSRSGKADEGHMAFNYWFHPPDSQEFARPYSSEFWPSDWEARQDRN